MQIQLLITTNAKNYDFLEPLSESDLDENVADMLKEALGRIRSLLNSINADETMTFVEFLEKLDLTEQQYVKAVRLSLKHSTLMLRRIAL